MSPSFCILQMAAYQRPHCIHESEISPTNWCKYRKDFIYYTQMNKFYSDKVTRSNTIKLNYSSVRILTPLAWVQKGTLQLSIFVTQKEETPMFQTAMTAASWQAYNTAMLLPRVTCQHAEILSIEPSKAELQDTGSLLSVSSVASPGATSMLNLDIAASDSTNFGYPLHIPVQGKRTSLIHHHLPAIWPMPPKQHPPQWALHLALDLITGLQAFLSLPTKHTVIEISVLHSTNKTSYGYIYLIETLIESMKRISPIKIG